MTHPKPNHEHKRSGNVLLRFNTKKLHVSGQLFCQHLIRHNGGSMRVCIPAAGTVCLQGTALAHDMRCRSVGCCTIIPTECR